MATKSVAFGVVAFLAGTGVMYLWQGRHALTPPVASQVEEIPIIKVTTPSPAPVPAPPQTAVPPASPVEGSSLPSAASPGVLGGTEFNGLLKRDMIEYLHSQFEAESVDPSWAAAMESQFGPYYSGKPGVIASFIQCKTTRCEVRVYGTGTRDELKANLSLISNSGSYKMTLPADFKTDRVVMATDEQDGLTVGLIVLEIRRGDLPQKP